MNMNETVKQRKGCIFNKRYYDELHLHENRKIFELFDNFSIDENDHLKIHVMLHCTFQQYLHKMTQISG